MYINGMNINVKVAVKLRQKPNLPSIILSPWHMEEQTISATCKPSVLAVIARNQIDAIAGFVAILIYNPQKPLLSQIWQI
jgi:hypothetical protein